MRVYDSIKLDEFSNEPKYIQLYGILKNLIEQGAIKPHEKLPTIRGLAKRLNVNSVTIVNAYKMLEQKGYVYTKVGSGTYVADRCKIQEIQVFSENPVVSHEYAKDCSNNYINFSTLTPGTELFPVKDFKQVINEVLDRDGAKAFTYVDTQGYFPLRESIRNYLNLCGIKTDIDNVSIISGAQQGIDLVAKVLVDFNDSIIIESPTYTGAAAIFKNRGANIIEVSLKEDGIDLDELEEVLKKQRIKLIYVMPNFQNPTCITYSLEKKLELINLAQKYNAYILEDDFLTEINFGKKSVEPLKALDFCDRVIYIKSFSKIFMPGLRLAILVSPSNISRNLIFAKQNTDISTSSLVQRAFDLYLREGMWLKHLNFLHGVYFKRYSLIKKLLNELTFFKYKEPSGGIHFWIESDIDSTILAYEAKRNGVLLALGRAFYLDNRNSNHFRISFAQVNEDEIIKGIDILKRSYEKIKMPGD